MHVDLCIHYTEIIIDVWVGTGNIVLAQVAGDDHTKSDCAG